MRALIVGLLLALAEPAFSQAHREDSPHQSGQYGSAFWCVRKDTAAALAADGDYIPCIVDATGRLWTNVVQYTEADTDATVTGTALMWEDTSDTLRVASAAKPLPVAIISGAGGGGVTHTDETGFTEGAGAFVPIGGVYNETFTDFIDDQAAAVRITNRRGLHVNLRDVNGNPIGIGGTPLHVAQSGTWSVNTKTALTATVPAAATVGVASAEARAANASRDGLIVTNTSANTISCAVGNTAVLNSGITLPPGATWSMDEYSFSTAAINCIASGAGSNLSIQEFQ
jgi:hypothetical protein